MRAGILALCRTRNIHNVLVSWRTMTTTVPHLVDSAWLQQELQQTNTKVKVFDSSLDYTGSPRGPFIEKHIPGALFFDLSQGIEPTLTIPRNLPEVAPFTEYVRSLGINTDTHLVFYDTGEVHYSTKAWWTFKTFGHQQVSVLNGGLTKWLLDGLPTESGDVTINQTGDFTVKHDKTMTIMYDDLIKCIRQKSSQIVDSRRLINFLGQESEPSMTSKMVCMVMGQPEPDKMHAGHMPGAIHIDLPEILDMKTKCFRSKEELQKLFQDKGIDLTRPLATTCYLGHMATCVNIAACVCGKNDAALYYGSWTEYGQRAPVDLVHKPMKEKL